MNIENENPMTDDLKELLTTVIKKLDKVSLDVESLSKRMATVEKGLHSLDSNMVTMMETPKSNDMLKELSAIRDGMAVMDSYHGNFATDIRLYGVAPTPGENLDNVVRTFMCEKLEADPDKVEKMRIYCQRMCRMSVEDIYRPIYVKFAELNDKRYIEGKATKRAKKLLAENLVVAYW